VEVHRSWSRRMRRELDELTADGAVETLVRESAARVKTGAAAPEGKQE